MGFLLCVIKGMMEFILKHDVSCISDEMTKVVGVGTETRPQTREGIGNGVRFNITNKTG